LRVPWERNILDAIVPFDQTRQCRWIVIDRKGGAGVVATIASPARFFFHTVPAFEEAVDGGKSLDIMCDMVDYDNLDVMYAFYYDVLLNRNGATERFWSKGDRASAGHANLTRYRLRIPLTSSPVKSKAAGARKGTLETVFSIPAPHVGELPTINQQYLSKPYRYVYSCANRGLSTLLDCIVKTDTATRDALIWEPPHAHSPGEPIFVPRPPTDGEILDEDDGVLLSVVLDGTTQRSYMVCIDAKTMTETGRAECEFPVGFGFHGLHTPFRR
jgi:torulene dioxygenase